MNSFLILASLTHNPDGCVSLAMSTLLCVQGVLAQKEGENAAAQAWFEQGVHCPGQCGLIAAQMYCMTETHTVLRTRTDASVPE